MLRCHRHGSGFESFALAHKVQSEAEVDEVLSHAVGAGATLVKKPEKMSWAGIAAALSHKIFDDNPLGGRQINRKNISTDIGEVLLERSGRARRLRISIKPFKGIRVAVPQGVTFDQAELAIQAKVPWMRKNLARMKEIENRHNQAAPIVIDREVARRILISRLVALAGQHGFTFNKVTIRNQKTRWGSCSVQNNISLNMKLAALPGELMDYVLLHELVHTRIKNHSALFWSELDNYIGNAKRLRERMRKYLLRVE